MGSCFSRIFSSKKHSSKVRPRKKAGSQVSSDGSEVGSLPDVALGKPVAAKPKSDTSGGAAMVDFAAAFSVFKNLIEVGMSEEHACTITAKYMASFTGNTTLQPQPQPQKLPADEDKKVVKTTGKSAPKDASTESFYECDENVSESENIPFKKKTLIKALKLTQVWLPTIFSAAIQSTFYFLGVASPPN